jgi:hypothetical protein
MHVARQLLAPIVVANWANVTHQTSVIAPIKRC